MENKQTRRTLIKNLALGASALAIGRHLQWLLLRKQNLNPKKNKIERQY